METLIAMGIITTQVEVLEDIAKIIGKYKYKNDN